MAALASIARYDAGERLHRPQAPAAQLWVIISGSVRAVATVAGNEQKTVAVQGPGSFFPVAAFVESVPIQFDHIAEVATEAAVIDAGELRRLVREDSALREFVPRMLLKLFHAVGKIHAESLATPLRQRIARRLLGQAQAQPGVEALKDVRISVSQHSLANLLGISRSQLSRELRELELAGILERSYRGIRVRDMRRLVDTAGPGVPLL